MAKKLNVVLKGWAVILDNQIIAVPIPNVLLAEDMCCFAIFHTKKEAIARKKWLTPSLQQETKIVYIKVVL